MATADPSPLPALLPAAPRRPAHRRTAPARWSATCLVKRYGVQDLCSKAAVLASSWLCSALCVAPELHAAACAAADLVAFYAAAFALRRRAPGGRQCSVRSTCAELAREYGPAEAVDLAVRPLAMRVGLLCPSPALGVLLGSMIADLAFYAAAAAAFRRMRLGA